MPQQTFISEKYKIVPYEKKNEKKKYLISRNVL